MLEIKTTEADTSAKIIVIGDAGIVYAQNGKKYIVVILANRPHNAPQGKDFIVKASSLIYKAIVGG